MCSVAELGILKDDYPGAIDDGILIFNEEYELGSCVKDILGLNEDVVEFEITSNRPDCFSVVGLAREAAVTYRKVFNKPVIAYNETDGNVSDYTSVEVLDSDLCPRYMAKVIKNVKIEPSPAWLRNRLRACGVRTINNIVDITNYVMLEYGQPMHAFDLNDISGSKIVVRRAKENEVIETLDEQERKLDSSMLVICDVDKPIAVAGVMGGANSEITSDTNTILFESANFEPSSVRITAKKLGMRTESSSRFEKGLDPIDAENAIKRACQLITELGAGEVVYGAIDVKDFKENKREIKLRADKINSFLGLDLSNDYMIDILQRLEFEVDKENMIVKVPTFRPDVLVEADIAEEIARFYGYDNIKPTLLSGEAVQGGKNYSQKIEEEIKKALIGEGFYEIETYSFTTPKVFDLLNVPMESSLREYITIMNPLGEENSIMRTTTISSMLETLARNYSHRAEEVKLFEIGRVYLPKKLPLNELPEEKEKVTLGMYGSYDFYDLKGSIEELLDRLGIYDYEILPCNDNPIFHPGRTALLKKDDKEFALLGEIYPTVLENYEIKCRAYVAEIDFESLKEMADFEVEYKQLPKYPSMSRDLALVVKDEIFVNQIEKIIKECAGNLLETITLFDIYKGKQIPEGMKSVAYSIVFRADNRTLKDDEVNTIFNVTVEKLRSNLGAKLRD
jgi:phenylalanyl-tRNA synthetase beta chain